MTKVDLDELAACIKGDQPFMSDETLAAIAELRAAREVVKAAKAVGHDTDPGYRHDPDCVTCRALAAYDKAVASLLTTPTRRP